MPINQRLCDQSRPPRQRDCLINLALDSRSEERGCRDLSRDPDPTPPDRPRPLESLCHGGSHKLFDYSFINRHLRRPRGKRTNERGAEDLFFVPLTLASPFACRSRVTSRDPFQREILLARLLEGPKKLSSPTSAWIVNLTSLRTADVSPRSSP